VFSLISKTRLRDIIDANQQLSVALSELRSTILPRLQRIESDLMYAKLGHLFEELHAATELAIREGVEAAEAVAMGLRAMAAPLRRGKAGGLARARTAWRFLDGTFMPESKKLEACLEAYERQAAGGRARAATAQRSTDGRFI
jgi:hypothetical protein